MPLHRRLPKRGFNSPTRDDVAEVRTGDLQALEAAEIDLAALKRRASFRARRWRAKVILAGKLERKIALKGIRGHKGARAMIEEAGGSIQLTPKPEAPKKAKKQKKAKQEQPEA